MSKVKKEGHKGGGNWKDFFHVIRKMRLPWHWIIIAFLCNFLYNRVMLDLPTVTAGLMSGSTDSQALVDAVWFYGCSPWCSAGMWPCARPPGMWRPGI